MSQAASKSNIWVGGVCFAGGLGSPRPYGREHHHSHPPPSPYHPSLPPPPPHPQQQQPPPNLPPPPQAQSQPMMYQQHQQQDSQYCPSYDPMGYPGIDRGRPLPPPHLQPGKSVSEDQHQAIGAPPSIVFIVYICRHDGNHFKIKSKIFRIALIFPTLKTNISNFDHQKFNNNYLYRI